MRGVMGTRVERSIKSTNIKRGIRSKYKMYEEGYEGRQEYDK